jgi:DNA-binding CsgD family transcriptional regulator
VVSVPRAKAGLCRSGCAVSEVSRSVRLGARRDARAIVVVHDPDSGSANTSEILEQGLGLSKGAARLVAALAADHDLKTFAESEGVTIHTARFHLRSALSRTGAKTQAEVVRIAVRLLRDFALADPHPAQPMP